MREFGSTEDRQRAPRKGEPEEFQSFLFDMADFS
jgi:hypothetical protein